MIEKVIIAVVLSLAGMVFGGYMTIVSLGVIGNADTTVPERITGTLGQILFFGAPIAATFYLVKEYRASKRPKKHGDKKALAAMLIGIAIVIGAFPTLILAEELSEQWASWRNRVHQERLVKEDDEWETQQRKNVCVTKDNVSYDFEFAGIYNKYELAYQALRDSDVPQSVRTQAADIIDEQIKHAYALCAEGRISPPTERERLKAAFDNFLLLAKPYSN